MSARKTAAKPAARPAAKPVRQPKVVTSTAPAAGDRSKDAMALAADLEKALVAGDPTTLTPEAVQALMAAVGRTYAAQVEANGHFLPLGQRSRMTSTDVMVTASGLLKAANLAVFELGMWQSWTGR